MSEPRARAATEDELADQCQHVCLQPDGHVSPHFYGYRLGPWSQEWLVAEVRRLRAERPVMLDVIEAANVVAHREDWTDPSWANPQMMADLDGALVRFDDLTGGDR